MSRISLNLLRFTALLSIAFYSAHSSRAQQALISISTGATPSAIVVNPANNMVYTANTGAGNVTAFNPQTTASSTITVGTSPLGIAANPMTNKIYVSNRDSNSVSVINSATNTVSATISVGSSPVAVVVNSATNAIYTANYTAGTVSVINGSTNSVTATVTVGAGAAALAVNPVTNMIYVANQNGNSVTVINGATNTAASTISVGTAPTDIAINAITNMIFVANTNSNNVSVINGATGTVVSTVAVGTNPFTLVVDVATNRVYVANYNSASVTQIDGSSYSTATITVGSGPLDIGVNATTNQIFTVNNASNSISVIDGPSKNVTTVGVGSGPRAIAVGIDNKLYVADTSGNHLTEVEGATYPQLAIQTGTSTNPTAGDVTLVNPNTNTTYIANFGAPLTYYHPAQGSVNAYNDTYFQEGSVTVINGNTGSIIATLDSGGSFPLVGAINPANNKVYVVNYFNGSQTVCSGGGDSCNSAVEAYGTVQVINGTTNTIEATTIVGELPDGIAVNPVNNDVYISLVCNPGITPDPNCPADGPTRAGNVVVIDGNTDLVKGSPIQVGNEPGAIAIDPVNNMVYVDNFFSDSITAISGSSRTAVATIATGHQPDWLALNPVTHKVYVANSNYCADAGYTSGMTIIDGTTNTVLVSNLTLDSNTPTPWGLVVDPATNKIYAGNANDSNALNCSNPNHVAVPPTGPSTITVVDGNTDAVIHTLTEPSNNAWLINDWGTLNPATDKIYFNNAISATVTIVDAATDATTTLTVPDTDVPSCNLQTAQWGCGYQGGLIAVNPATNVAWMGEPGCCFNGEYANVIFDEGFSVVPLLTSISPVSDAYTVATDPAFITTNTSPSFTFSSNSEFSSYAPYNLLTITEPPPTSLYYSLDSLKGPWYAATVTSSSGANPATFSGSLSGLSVGQHMIYAYAAYGREGTPDGTGNSSGNSPDRGTMASAFFVVQP